MQEYPLTLYRDGSALVWDGRGIDLIIVCDPTGERAAAADGWKRADAFLQAATLDAVAPKRRKKDA